MYLTLVYTADSNRYYSMYSAGLFPTSQPTNLGSATAHLDEHQFCFRRVGGVKSLGFAKARGDASIEQEFWVI